jgi:hypothetical protein
MERRGEGGKRGERGRCTIIGVLAKCSSIASILLVNWSKISSRTIRPPSSSSSGSDGAQILSPSSGALERRGTGRGEWVGRWLCGMNVVAVSSLRWGRI